MSDYLELYKEVKQVMKKMQKKGCFYKFSTKDFFYLMDEKTRGVLVFSEHLYQDGYGIQLFLNNPGLNYLHDILSTEGNYPINYFYSDCNLLGFIPKKDLLPDDVKFLKEHHIRINEENNLLPIKFKEGFGKTIMTKKELSETLSYLYYAYALICNEKEDVEVALKNELTPLAIFNNKEMEYSCHYTPLPNLEQMPKNKKVNALIVEDLKNCNYVDDVCYFFHSYFPEKITNGNSFKTIILAYFTKSKNYKLEIFDVEPSKIDQYFYGYMDEVFNEYGKPLTVLFNHRYLYSISSKTLKKLDIECRYDKEHGDYDKMVYDLLVEQINNYQNVDDYMGDDEEFLEEDIQDECYVS